MADCERLWRNPQLQCAKANVQISLPLLKTKGLCFTREWCSWRVSWCQPFSSLWWSWTFLWGLSLSARVVLAQLPTHLLASAGSLHAFACTWASAGSLHAFPCFQTRAQMSYTNWLCLLEVNIFIHFVPALVTYSVMNGRGWKNTIVSGPRHRFEMCVIFTW